jgi:hypothetical protein
MTTEEIRQLLELLDKATGTLACRTGTDLKHKLALIKLAKRIGDGRSAVRLASYELDDAEQVTTPGGFPI